MPHYLIVDQVGTPPANGSVTYTPMRRPGAAAPPAAAAKPAPAPIAPVVAAPAPVAPTFAAPAPVAPTYAAPAPIAPVYSAPPDAATTWATPTPYAPAPLPLPPGLPPATPTLSIRGANAAPVATATAKAHRSAELEHRYFGLASDVGMPDGLNLGVVLAPVDWMRLGASMGTNSASLDYRGGLTLVPMGWGPSFSAEVGHCNTAATTSVIRTFFTVPNWVKPYVQQLGYTYVNAHVGFDFRVGGLTLFVHGGVTYLMGTVRSPNAVVVDSNTSTSVKIAQDGQVTAYTLSAKAGLLYMFGGS